MKKLGNNDNKSGGTVVSDRYAALVIALSKSVEIFTSHSEQSFNDMMSNGLKPIAQAADVQRVAVYQLLEGNDRLGQTYVWAHGKTIDLDNELIELPDYPPVVRWVKTMAKGKIVNDHVDKMTKEEADFLTLFKVKSIFMVPIFTHNKFWGFVTIEDQVNCRYFDEDCHDLLCSAARLCASALIRMEMTRSTDKAVDTLKRREQLVDTLNKTAIIFLSQSNVTFEESMTAGVQNIADAIDLDRMSIWRNSIKPDGLHSSQIYRWERVSGGTTEPRPELVDVTFKQLAPEWEELLAKGGSRSGPIEEMPEAAVLRSYGIISAFVTPIFINNSFWGFALFEDIRNKRHFEDDVVETMRSAAFLCANAFLREEMERRITEANEFNRILIESAPTGFTVIDENLNVLDCNDYILNLFKTSKDAYKNNFTAFSPEFQNDGQKSGEKAVSIVKQALNGERVTCEWMHCSSTGTLIPSEITLVRIKFNGEYAVLGFQYNLSRIKEIEQEALEANVLNRVLIDYAPIGLSVIENDFTVINCNEAVLRMFETTREYYTNHFREFSPEFQKDGSRSSDKAREVTMQAREGQLLTFEWMHCTKSGKPVPTEVTLTRTRHNGKFVTLAYQYDLTNLKKMEEEIAAANDFNRALIDTAPIGLTIIDDNLKVVDCNDTMLKLCGSTSCDYYAEHFWDFSAEYQPDGSLSSEKGRVLIKQALDGEKQVVEWMHCTLNGEHIPSEVTMIRVKQKGKYLVLGYQYDLRNIKKIEGDLLEAEELARAIKEASPIAYVLFDENLNVIDCNDAAMRIFGCSNKQYLLDHYWDVFLPATQPDGSPSRGKATMKRDEASISSVRQATFEWYHRSSLGELIPTENTLTRVTHKGKDLIISFKYDLRSTKKMMENIREQSELLKIRLEQQELISEISRGFISSGDSETYVREAIAKLGRYHNVSMVYVFSVDYQLRSATPAYYWSESGAPPRAAADFDLYDTIKSSFPDRLPDCATVPVIACSDVAAGSAKAYSPLLGVDVHAFICAPLYVEGNLWGILSVEQCHKPRQWTESEKGFVAVTASTIAGVIMRDIYNTMLKEALRKATVASKAKGEFLSNMSHEMRTPLNAIIGMTTIGKNAGDLEHKDYALDKIGNASTHLLGVINDVLDMSKIEANKFELSPAEYNFEKMLQRVASVINFRVDEKKQQFKVLIDPTIPKTLIGDDQRLTQVITNLLGNAVKFTPEGGSITLDTHFMEENDGVCTIQVAVSDTGIGISPEQQAKLFQSFQQAEASTTRKFGGTGLGLAISKNIVELMGGKIWIESELGKGATFLFTILAKRGVEKTQGLLAQGVNLGNVRILAVDDDPDILDYFKDVMKEFGASCDTALSGEEALRLVDKNDSYNIYFIDWKMPGIDGIELTARLKEKKPAPGNTVVIMISAADWNSVEKEAREAGVDKFLSKPLFPSPIADVINECLGLNKEETEEVLPSIDGLFEGHRILLVEDVDINREIVLTLLDPTRLKIDCAENGVQAVRIFSESPERYDLIFMDVQMPEMDGYEATRCIRALEAERWKEKVASHPELAKSAKPKGVPIIAMTANVFREDIEKCLRAGMNSHVGKPLDFEQVLERLRTYLRS